MVWFQTTQTHPKEQCAYVTTLSDESYEVLFS